MTSSPQQYFTCNYEVKLFFSLFYLLKIKKIIRKFLESFSRFPCDRLECFTMTKLNEYRSSRDYRRKFFFIFFSSLSFPIKHTTEQNVHDANKITALNICFETLEGECENMRITSSVDSSSYHTNRTAYILNFIFMYSTTTHVLPHKFVT
jgi:hypothetical protein